MDSAGSRRRTPSWRGRAALGLAAVGLAVACGGGDEPAAAELLPRPERAEQPRPEEPVVPMDALAALGYADWDAGADEELSGVVRHDRARSWPGINLWTNDVDAAFAMDMEGRIVHRWELPGSIQFETFELQPDGGILGLSVGETLARLDRAGKSLWIRRWPVHHDATRDPAGGYVALTWTRAPEYRGRRVRFDGLVFLSEAGKIERYWDSGEHMEALARWHEPSELDTPPLETETGRRRRFDYYHMNSVEVLLETPLGERDDRFRAGNLLVCFRNVNLVAVLDRESLEVTWGWGPGELELPHMPTMLENGNILIYDNGPFRGWSRVIELEPASGEVVWEWPAEEDRGAQSFFSEWRGSCQRLPNGNTLICESERGRVFEVTREGELVWEFWNPDLVDGRRRRIYRMLRVPEAALGNN